VGPEQRYPCPRRLRWRQKNGHCCLAAENGVWYILPSGTPGSYTATAWGATGDRPLSGDYNGDGKADISVWRQNSGVWYILSDGASGGYIAQPWGMEGDMPISATAGILRSLP